MGENEKNSENSLESSELFRKNKLSTGKRNRRVNGGIHPLKNDDIGP